MTQLGHSGQDLPFTVCSSFQPTVLEGQLCYSMTVKDIFKTKAGLKNGLSLILDQGSMVETKETEMKDDQYLSSLQIHSQEGDSRSARIYLSTLASFTDNRAGSYALSSLKKMTVTENFLGLSDIVKACQIETFEDCQVNSYIREVEKQCGCVPIALTMASSVEVKLTDW